MKEIVVLLNFVLFISGQLLEFQKIESFQSCWTDSDCKKNSFCYGNDDYQRGRCKCLRDFVINRNSTFYECVKPAKLGESCNIDFQCYVTAGSMAICNKQGICQCNELAHNYTDGLCYKNVDVGDYCISSAYCNLDDGRFAYCTDGRCECAPSERPSLDKRRCFLSKNLGDSCITDSECKLIPNAHCEVVCRCLIDYVITRDGKDCLKAATKFGDECIEDDQCGKFLLEGVCEQNNCTCPKGLHSIGTRCYESKSIGEVCFNEEECILDRHLKGNVICQDKCKCVYGEANNEWGCALGNSSLIINIDILYALFCALFPLLFIIFL